AANGRRYPDAHTVECPAVDGSQDAVDHLLGRHRRARRESAPLRLSLEQHLDMRAPDVHCQDGHALISPDPHQIVAGAEPIRSRRRERLAGLFDRGGSMSRPKLVLVLFAALVVAATAAGFAVAGKSNGNNKTFEYAIGLWGDIPYSDTQATTGVPNLIDDVNSQDISFSVHDGDLKAGNATPGSATPTNCQNAVQPSIYSQALGFFNSLDKPAIFTPGDNDWTDCDRTSNGGFNSLERLQYERGVFFASDLSLGRHPMQLEVQTAPLCQGTTSSTGQPRFMTGCVEN